MVQVTDLILVLPKVQNTTVRVYCDRSLNRISETGKKYDFPSIQLVKQADYHKRALQNISVPELCFSLRFQSHVKTGGDLRSLSLHIFYLWDFGIVESVL